MISFGIENSDTLSQHEIKCPSCGKWTPGDSETCVYCGALVDPQLRDQQEREVRAAEEERERIASQSPVEKKLAQLKNSDNPIARFAFGVLNVLWLIYMGIVSFIIWFTAIFSG